METGTDYLKLFCWSTHKQFFLQFPPHWILYDYYKLLIQLIKCGFTLVKDVTNLHKSTLEKHDQRNHRNSVIQGSIPIIKKRKLDAVTKNKIHMDTAKLISKCDLPIQFFEGQEVRAWVKSVIEKSGGDSSNFKEFCPNKKQIKAAMLDNRIKVREILKKTKNDLIHSGKLRVKVLLYRICT